MADFYARLISADPMIVMGGTGNGLLGPARPIGATLANSTKVLYLLSFWQAVHEPIARNIAHEISDWKAQHKNQEFLYLANDLYQLEVLKRIGVPSILANHNLFVSEQNYSVDLPSGGKDMDAIYNARMTQWKRHDLCSDLKSVGFIYYFNPPGDFSWYNQVRTLTPRAHFLNGDPNLGEYRHFNSVDLKRQYNRAKVGLCLSNSEGAMLSSMEYLMCGIPVLTVPNFGGRNHFFRPEFAVEVNPDANAVAQGVGQLINRHLDPNEVRREVLRMVLYEREIFFEHAERHCKSLGFDINFAKAFKSRFIDKMWTVYATPEQFFRDSGLETRAD